MELKYIFRMLFRKKWIILSLTILTVATAFMLTRNQKRLFKSFAQISTGYTVSEDMKLTDDNFNISQIDVKFSNAIENITSPKVVSLLSYSLIIHDLTSKPTFRNPNPDLLKKYPDLAALNKADLVKTFTRKRDSLQLLNTGDPYEKKLLRYLELYRYDIESLKALLTVARYQRTDYINITCRSESPALSSFVVNNLVTEFQRYFESFRRDRSTESITTLDSMVRKRKDELDNLIAIRSQFMTDSGVLDPNVETSNLSQISQFETLLAETRGVSQNLGYQVAQLSAQIRTLESGGGGTVPNNSRQSNNDEYMILRKQYNDLYTDYVSRGSNDPETKRRLDELKIKMQSSVNTVAPIQDQGTVNKALQLENLKDRRIQLEGELRSANVKISYYQGRLNQLRGTVGGQSSKTGALQQLDKDIEIATAEYTAVKDKSNLASNMTEGLGNNFTQTMFGQPSTKPEPSGRFMILALSGITSFLLTSFVFIFLLYIDQSIKTPSQFTKVTGLKLLGVINKIPLKNRKISDMVIADKEAENRKNSFRELLRKVRFEIESSGKRVFLFTSTEPQQGKTTLTQALAYSLSLSKKKVLILDTNFCNNDITAMNSAAPTLEDFSGNGHALEFDEYKHLITNTGQENVDIIGCKGGDYTPSEILPKNHLLNYLPDLLKEYDYIFMEGAPLNGYTDSKELAEYADRVIAIFSAESEIKNGDKASLNFLRNLKEKFLGGVLNKVEAFNVKL